jgi:hypothetical protein
MQAWMVEVMHGNDKIYKRKKKACYCAINRSIIIIINEKLLNSNLHKQYCQYVNYTNVY